MAIDRQQSLSAYSEMELEELLASASPVLQNAVRKNLAGIGNTYTGGYDSFIAA